MTFTSVNRRVDLISVHIIESKQESIDTSNEMETCISVLGSLHMSPVTGLARLPGRILLSVHMGHFSPVDRDEIQETKPNGETNLYRSRLS